MRGWPSQNAGSTSGAHPGGVHPLVVVGGARRHVDVRVEDAHVSPPGRSWWGPACSGEDEVGVVGAPRGRRPRARRRSAAPWRRARRRRASARSATAASGTPTNRHFSTPWRQSCAESRLGVRAHGGGHESYVVGAQGVEQQGRSVDAGVVDAGQREQHGALLVGVAVAVERLELVEERLRGRGRRPPSRPAPPARRPRCGGRRRRRGALGPCAGRPRGRSGRAWRPRRPALPASRRAHRRRPAPRAARRSAAGDEQPDWRHRAPPPASTGPRDPVERGPQGGHASSAATTGAAWECRGSSTQASPV